MKILHLFAFRFWSGPAETIFNLAMNQRRAGHEVYVALNNDDDVIRAEESSKPYFQNKNLLLSGNYLLSPKHCGLSIFKDILFFSNMRVDIIHVHSTHDHFIGGLSSLINKWCRPRIVRSIHKNNISMPPIVPTHAVTAPCRQFLNDMGKDIPKCILPAIISELYVPATNRNESKKYCSYQKKYTIGMVSTFKESRNHRLGLKAFAEFHRFNPNSELILIGDGVEEDDLRKLVSDLSIFDKVAPMHAKVFYD
ncbi:MAG TPA: hypothetical protein EYO59_01365, partial [Chromatiaceae bacterium]|nr:hypothetical protein [Chromatiaceae bacterium]